MLLQNNKKFLGLIFPFKLILLTRFEKLRESYKFVCFLVPQTKFFMKICGLILLQVF